MVDPGGGASFRMGFAVAEALAVAPTAALERSCFDVFIVNELNSSSSSLLILIFFANNNYKIIIIVKTHAYDTNTHEQTNKETITTYNRSINQPTKQQTNTTTTQNLTALSFALRSTNSNNIVIHTDESAVLRFTHTQTNKQTNTSQT